MGPRGVTSKAKSQVGFAPSRFEPGWKVELAAACRYRRQVGFKQRINAWSRIEVVPLVLRLPGQSTPLRTHDFAIDGELLSEKLGVDRANLLACNTPLDYGSLLSTALDEYITALLGHAPAPNQFGTGRLVLYGCHCGCDYCGVVSCTTALKGNLIIWSDFGGEEFWGRVRRHPPITFHKPQLEAELSRFRDASVTVHEQ